jgi:DNA-binding LacI/PurR family transcriptional regulator
VLQEAGRRIPHDVAVIGWDDLDEAQYSIPSLSTVDPGRQWIARTAVSTLLARIASPDAPDRDRLHLADFTLMSRESAAFVPR